VTKRKKKVGGLTGKLLAVAPEYRFGLYKQLQLKKLRKHSKKGSPVLSGSYENGKRR
jgi:predicted acetyltransferase